MEKSSISGWHYPTTVLFIDDNRNFLKSLSLRLNPKIMAPKLFDDPLNALEFLQTCPPTSELIKRWLSSTRMEDSGHHSIDVNVNAIHQEIYNPERFSEISVIVVDYAMPSLNGLDFCSRVRAETNHLKILMLTGEADEKIAVEAFNQKVIDKFIRKDTPDFQHQLNHTIEILQKAYFQELSETILNALNHDLNDPVAHCLKDPVFIALFDEICQKNHISEYYLIDSDGSFLMLDFEAKPHWLMVKTETSMEDAYQVALNADQPFPQSLLAAMKNREKILCLYEEDLCDDPDKAEKLLFPAKKLVGKDVYYYAVLDNPKIYDSSPEKILSYKNFLEND